MKGVKGAEMRSNHILGHAQIDRWPLTSGGHKDRVASFTFEAKPERAARLLRRHIDVEVGERTRRQNGMRRTPRLKGLRMCGIELVPHCSMFKVSRLGEK